MLSGNIASTINKLFPISSKISLHYELFPEISGDENKKKIDDLRISDLLMLSINTTISVGKIIRIEPKKIELSLNIPIVPIKNDNVGIAKNINNHWRLIGYGTIV